MEDIGLLYYGNLYVEEVARLEMRNFEPPNRVAAGWSIRVRARPGWHGGQTVFTPPPLSDTIGRWIKQREAPRLGSVTFRIRDAVDALLGLEGEQVARHGRQVVRLASSLALERGDVANGMRLRDRSLVCLRGAFAAHQRRRPIQMLQAGQPQLPEGFGESVDEARALFEDVPFWATAGKRLGGTRCSRRGISQ